MTINDRLYRLLRDIQGKLISLTKKDWSFTAIINLILLAGALTPTHINPNLEEKFWMTLRSFITGEKLNLSGSEAVVQKWVHNLLGEERHKYVNSE